MRKITFILVSAIIAVLCCTNIYAQNGDHYKQGFRNSQPGNKSNVPSNSRIKHVQALKIAYIINKLNLSSSETERFTPVYSQYQNEITDVLRQKRANNLNPDNNGRDQVDKDYQYEVKLLDIRKRYKDKFMDILPAEKVSLIYKSEREFNDEVIKQLRERNQPDN